MPEDTASAVSSVGVTCTPAWLVLELLRGLGWELGLVLGLGLGLGLE
jgi:hypothetical protein